MARKIVQKHTRLATPPQKNGNPKLPTTFNSKAVVQNIKRELPNSKVVIQNIKRELPKVPVFSSPNLLSHIKNFTRHNDKHYYLGFGGLGDALLLMAVCWNDPKAKVVFFANHIPFIRSFFDLFGISVYLHDNIMGTPIAAEIYNTMMVLPNFKSSAHLADGLNYNDWSNENKYTPRIKSSVSWAGHLGKEKFDKPVVIIAPSGSNKNIQRQRYLHHHEYQQLVDLYLNKNYIVYATGSITDLHHFKLINKDNFYWLCSDTIYSGSSNVEKIDLRKMLRIINSAVHVISMDSWLKSYTLLCNILTKVVKTRWDGKYKPYGEDVTDWIFLNTDIWPSLKMTTIEELLT